MEVGADHEVVLISHEYSEASRLDSCAKAFRGLRLRALQSDPASFSSSYTTESQQPLSFWTKRLRNPQAKTFALIDRDIGAQRHQVSGPAPERLWLGMLVLLGPEAVDPNAFDNASSWKATLTENSCKSEEPQSQVTRIEPLPASSVLAYHIVAVYVAPEVRGKGLAKKLMSSAFAAVEQDLEEKGSNNAICTIGVAKDIPAARKTYESMGFVAVAEDHYITDDGREFHDSVMRKDLAV